MAKRKRARAQPSADQVVVGRRPDEWIVLVTGRSNSGKTTWVRKALALERGAVVAWDPTAGLAGAGRWDFQGRARDFLERQASSPARLQRVRTWGTIKEFEALCFYMQRAGNAVFAIDEAHVCLPPTLSTKHPFCDLLVQVRHLRTPLILVTWRPYNLPAYSRSSMQRVVAFRTTDARSIEWLEDEAGAPTGAAATLVGLHTGPKPSNKPRYLDWRI